MRGGYAARAASLVLGLFLFAIGIVLILESKLGLSPWDVLNQGIAKHTPLSFGMANVAVAIVVLGGTFGVGTVLFALLVGPVVESSFALLARSPLAAPVEEYAPFVIAE